jgi:hypothetical protein
MIGEHFHLLSRTPGVLTRPPAATGPGAEQPVGLPPAHRELLSLSDGIAVFDGYFRMLGLTAGPSWNLVSWNNESCWKFAWGNRCKNYFCFAETAWGDQYAYEVPRLLQGDDSVFLLDAISMTPEVIAAGFVEFFEMEFLRNATKPYDEMVLKARRALGPLDLGSLLVYSPPLSLGGSEDVANIQKAEARAAMICNGDMAIQLDGAPQYRKVAGVETYQDPEGRTRLRVIWQP